MAEPNVSPGSHSNVLSGVAVISATNAWAVGNYSNGTINQAQALIVHWNGTAWKQQSSPSPGSAVNTLTGVAATSAPTPGRSGTTTAPGLRPRP